MLSSLTFEVKMKNLQRIQIKGLSAILSKRKKNNRTETFLSLNWLDQVSLGLYKDIAAIHPIKYAQHMIVQKMSSIWPKIGMIGCMESLRKFEFCIILKNFCYANCLDYIFSNQEGSLPYRPTSLSDVNPPLLAWWVNTSKE